QPRASEGPTAFGPGRGHAQHIGALRHGQAGERQLAQPGLLWAGKSARLATSDRGWLLDRMKAATARQATGGSGRYAFASCRPAFEAHFGQKEQGDDGNGPAVNHPRERAAVRHTNGT